MLTKIQKASTGMLLLSKHTRNMPVPEKRFTIEKKTEPVLVAVIFVDWSVECDKKLNYFLLSKFTFENVFCHLPGAFLQTCNN